MPPNPKGRHGPRSKQGCKTCRLRKIKCDEIRPICRRCEKGHRDCDYGEVQNKELNSLLDIDNTGFQSPQNPRHSEESYQDLPTTPAILNSEPNDVERTPSASSREQYLQRVLDEFSQSLQTKSSRWSFVTGLFELCRTNPSLKHLLLATAGYHSSSLAQMEYHMQVSIEHYRRGLQDFARLIASEDFEPQVLLTGFYFLMAFELRFGHNVSDLSQHLQGFKQALHSYGTQLIPHLDDPFSTTGSSFGSKESRVLGTTGLPRGTYRAVLNRLGLWILYIDILASSFDLGGAVVREVLKEDPYSLNRIFVNSRNALPEIWGESYPASERLDDIENNSPFELYHDSHLLRFKVAELRRAIESKEDCQNRISRFELELADASARYSDMIVVAIDRADTSSSNNSRLRSNIRFIVAWFWAVVLEFNRIAYFNDPLPETGTKALKQILQLCVLIQESDGPDSMHKVSWPLFIAGLETTDPVHQNWILAELQALRPYGTNVAHAHSALSQFIKRQRESSRRLDFLHFLREEELPGFVLY